MKIIQYFEDFNWEFDEEEEFPIGFDFSSFNMKDLLNKFDKNINSVVIILNEKLSGKKIRIIDNMGNVIHQEIEVNKFVKHYKHSNIIDDEKIERDINIISVIYTNYGHTNNDMIYTNDSIIVLD